MSMQDVSDIPVLHLIQALWTNATPRPTYIDDKPILLPCPTFGQLRDRLKDSVYIGYINGRSINCDFGDMTSVDTSLYDRFEGGDAFLKVMSNMSWDFEPTYPHISDVDPIYPSNVLDVPVSEIVKALWLNAKPAEFYTKEKTTSLPCPTDNQIDEKLKACDGYINYINGKWIRCNFSDMTKVDPSMYDRQEGDGSFWWVVATLCEEYEQKISESQ